MTRITLPRRALGAAALATLARPAFAQATPVRIGELNSYARMAAFAVPYRNAMQLAQDTVNAAGGVMGGRPIELVFRDDGSTPGDAVRVAEELLTRENVAFLVGTFLSNVGLAVADFANQRKRLFLATEPLTDAITMAQGNRYTFRVRPSTFMQTKMLAEAIRGKTAKKWAIVAPNYEYGQSAAANFKRLLPEVIPGAEIVAEQFPALGRIDAGATVGALSQSRPDGIFNVLFGADLNAFVREGNTRGLFERRTVVSLLTGEPEYLIPLGDETPEGWIVTGYPWETINTPEHKAFVKAYQAKYKDDLRLGSVVGYSMIKSLVEGVKRAGGKTDTDSMVKAFAGLKVATPDGPIEYRALDHQSTMGTYVGKIALKDGKGVMVDHYYVPGDKLLPSDDEVRKLRASN